MEGETGRPLRRIAIEEAFALPEQVAAMRAMAAAGHPSMDIAMWRPMLGSHGEGTPLLDRLLDLTGQRIDVMDAAGIDFQLLSLTSPGVQILPTGEAVAMARLANDRLAGFVADRPERFGGLASFAPQDPASAVREMERAARELGLNGFIVNSHTNGEYLDQEKFWPILEAAEALDKPIYIHPRTPPDAMAPFYDVYSLSSGLWGFNSETGLHAMRLIMSGVLDRFPRLRIVLGHMGEGIPYWFWRYDLNRNSAVSADKPALKLMPSEYFKRNFWISTSGMFDTQVLQFCLGKLGAERILFAIDYPYGHADPLMSQHAAAFLDAAPISRHERALIAHGNAESLFGIAPRPA